MVGSGPRSSRDERLGPNEEGARSNRVEDSREDEPARVLGLPAKQCALYGVVFESPVFRGGVTEQGVGDGLNPSGAFGVWESCSHSSAMVCEPARVSALVRNEMRVKARGFESSAHRFQVNR